MRIKIFTRWNSSEDVMSCIHVTLRTMPITWWALLLFFFSFWPCYVACKILVPQPGTEPVPSAWGAQNLNHWTTREVSCYCFWPPPLIFLKLFSAFLPFSSFPSTYLIAPSCLPGSCSFSAHSERVGVPRALKSSVLTLLGWLILNQVPSYIQWLHIYPLWFTSNYLERLHLMPHWLLKLDMHAPN